MSLEKIKSIDPGSPLRGKVHPGDCIVQINGQKIVDVLDYKFFSYEKKLNILVRQPDGKEKTITVRHPEGMDLGLNFEEYLMDRPRSCANNCIFCFVDQLPPGMRKTMYFKDDDTRLSFLLGNYITMTNLSNREIQRIIDLHISPINVSVHTTNKELRSKMLRNPRAGDTIDIMRRLAEHGITMNCQIVCCPGINDGDELLHTMQDLEQMHPSVYSVSIVPLGITKYRENLYPLTPFDKESAGKTIEIVEGFAEECYNRHGTKIFFCSDEMYIKAGRELPEDEYYEAHTQLDNGVGMIRLLQSEFKSALMLSDRPKGKRNFSMACGVDVAPYLQGLMDMAAEKYDNVKGHVYPIINNFFGETITVSGLVTGQDLIAQLKNKSLGDYLLISSNMIRKDEQDFLDDVTLKQASEALGIKIIPVGQDGFELWDAIEFPEDTTERIPIIHEKETEYYRYNT